MAATLLDMGDRSLRLPSMLVLDASLVLHLYRTDQRPKSRIARNFLTRLEQEARAGRIELLLPLLAFEECVFKILRFETEAKVPIGPGGSPSQKRNDFIRRQHEEVALAYPKVASFHRQIEDLPAVIVDPDDLKSRAEDSLPHLAEQMLDFVRQFEILPKDAAILAEAERMGVKVVASIDADWTRATGFTTIAPR